MVNTANDGSDNGDWEIIKELGVPCFTTIDRPRWDTRRFSNGTHKVRVEALQPVEIGNEVRDVEEASYTLGNRKPPAPVLISPSTDLSRHAFLSDRTVTFRWEPSDRTDNYVLYLSLTHTNVVDDPNPLLRVVLPASQTSFTYTFDQFYSKVNWGVIAQNSLGYGGADVGYSIGLDNQSPTAAVASLPSTSDTSSFVINLAEPTTMPASPTTMCRFVTGQAAPGSSGRSVRLMWPLFTPDR